MRLNRGYCASKEGIESRQGEHCASTEVIESRKEGGGCASTAGITTRQGALSQYRGRRRVDTGERLRIYREVSAHRQVVFCMNRGY